MTSERGPGADTPAGQRIEGSGGGARLRWLDALRGIAVLAVVYEHFADHLWWPVKNASTQWFHAGTFGVTLFFLVSGYIVPASIERRGSVRHFWIGRLFRLYPAFLATIAVVYLVSLTVEPKAIPEDVRNSPGTTLLAHLTMLQDTVGAPLIQLQFWTLSSEMLFYLLVTVIFVFGVHRFSAEIALLLAAAALLIGSSLPVRKFVADPADLTGLTVVVALVLIGGVVAVSNRSRGVIITGAVVLTVLVVTLLGANQQNSPWEGLVILAVMFTGTALYRAEQGQISQGRAMLAVFAVLGAAFVLPHSTGGMWTLVPTDDFPLDRSWFAGVLLAFVVFAVGMALRQLPIPAPLAWLGAVSYSVYLLHYVVIYLGKDIWPAYNTSSVSARLAVTAGYLAAVLIISYASYRLVELPFQGWGRTVSRRFDPPRPAAAEPKPEPEPVSVAASPEANPAWGTHPASATRPPEPNPAWGTPQQPVPAARQPEPSWGTYPQPVAAARHPEPHPAWGTQPEPVPAARHPESHPAWDTPQPPPRSSSPPSRGGQVYGGQVYGQPQRRDPDPGRPAQDT